MKAAGVVAEFNPFHKGHLYLLQQIKANGAETVVVAMSGCFVQRGEPAVLSAAARTQAALRGGADLVLELPLPWSMAGAQRFALGGVGMLDAVGVADTLCFGSECGDINLMKKAAALAADDEVLQLMKQYLAEGIPFAAAREKAVCAFDPACGAVLQNSNDILGVEYLNALSALNSSLTPFCIKRVGVGHDMAADGTWASGSALREMLIKGDKISQYIPDFFEKILRNELDRGRAPACISSAERAIISRMRTVTAAELREAPDVSEGLENRILSAAQQASGLEELYALAKTKRFSHARIRRVVMSTFLGVAAGDGEGIPPYAAVLGFTENGQKLLREMKEKSRIPVLMKHGDAALLDERGRRIYDLQCRAADQYALCLPQPAPCGEYQRSNPVILKG